MVALEPCPLLGRLDDDGVVERRRLHCRSYNACLDHVHAAGADGWWCEVCPAYEAQAHEDEVSDLHALAAALRAAWAHRGRHSRETTARVVTCGRCGATGHNARTCGRRA